MQWNLRHKDGYDLNVSITANILEHNPVKTSVCVHIIRCERNSKRDLSSVSFQLNEGQAQYLLNEILNFSEGYDLFADIIDNPKTLTELSGFSLKQRLKMFWFLLSNWGNEYEINDGEDERDSEISKSSVRQFSLK